MHIQLQILYNSYWRF